MKVIVKSADELGEGLLGGVSVLMLGANEKDSCVQEIIKFLKDQPYPSKNHYLPENEPAVTLLFSKKFSFNNFAFLDTKDDENKVFPDLYYLMDVVEEGIICILIKKDTKVPKDFSVNKWMHELIRIASEYLRGRNKEVRKSLTKVSYVFYVDPGFPTWRDINYELRRHLYAKTGYDYDSSNPIGTGLKMIKAIENAENKRSNHVSENSDF
ncbi:MAG: hypothetical protein WC795_02300 [Candidatus Paceibacterota bacterium]|jgi:hypothetical protein